LGYDAAVILDPETLSPGEVYRFMIGAIVPRPIAFVSTVGRAGFNLAPFSYFAPLTSRPPLLGISMQSRAEGPKDTLRNLRETGDFVVNLVTEELGERMVQTSGEWPEEVDEFQLTGLTPVASDRVRAPRVAESPVNLECRLYREVPLGAATFVIGELVLAHVDDRVLREGRVDPTLLRPLGRLGGDGYAPLGGVILRPRPRVERGGPPAGK
jgi:flavin reductase (DIM6/NTAB) family NADH-FMN oxidoreductase RutF